MADFLEPPGEPGIVEHEADVIFDDAQSFPRAIGRGVENSPQIDASAGLAELERGIPSASGSGARSTCDGFGQTLAHRLELQARRPQQLRGGTGGREQAREQMLGPHFSLAVRSARLHRRFVQDLSQGRRDGQRLKRTLVAGRLGFELRSLRFRQGLRNPRAESGPETVHLDAELHQQLAGAALRLGGQGGQQIERLDDRRILTFRQQIGSLQGSPRTGRE